LTDEDGFPREGTVDSLNGSLDPNTGTARWRAKVPNRDELLLPGMSAKVRLPLGEPHPALLIPDEAHWIELREEFVIVVSGDGLPEIRKVTIGGLHEGKREVKTGLKDDEWVVVSRLHRAIEAARRRTKIGVDKDPIPEGPSSGSRPRR
jgi:multidrug efflux pump subunit AcrA (membrane-fusion protein)